MRILLFFLCSMLPLISSATEAQENKTLRTDRVWVYSCKHDTQNYEIEFRFDRFEEKNSKTYLVYTYTSYGKPQEVLLREEESRIYRYSESDVFGYGTSEFLIYDFNLNKGDRFELIYGFPNCYQFQDSHFEHSGIVSESIHISLSGAEYKVVAIPYYEASSDRIIEGIGSFDFGFLAGMFFPDQPTGHEWDIDDVSFKMLRNIDGKVLFDRSIVEAEIGNALGVNETNIDYFSDGRMYDLTGREIREPQQGTVYIQDGRKKVKR